MTARPTNWAGNVTFAAAHFHEPASVSELQRLVATSARIRALGSGHSFNRIADTTGDLISVAALPPVFAIDAAGGTVTVSAGVRYGELAVRLAAAGYALGNLASLPHISVAGACATGTHGSGVGNQNLAAAVSGMTVVRADGELETVSRQGGDSFAGTVVSLGALGLVTTVTLDIVPTFDVGQYVYDNLPGAVVAEHFDDIVSAAYSVSLFTDWSSPATYQVWVKRRTDETGPWLPEPSWLGARLADGQRHPIPGMATLNCTEQLGVAGSWQDRLPHFRLDFTPSSGAELQTEYLLPRADAAMALAAVGRISNRLAPLVQICEIRTVAADDLWLSPSYGRDTVAIHFTWVPDTAAVTPVLALLEEALAPFDARPHWGKLFTTAPAVIDGLYERLPDFRALMTTYDPEGKFRNEFMDTHFA